MGWFSRKLHPKMQHELEAIADRDDPEAWSAILRAQGQREVAELLKGKERRAIALQTLTALKPLPLGASRIGGAPDLPADFLWPDGQALLAQINLGEMPLPPEHPLQGHLWFFMEDGGACSVQWRPQDVSLQRHARSRFATCEIRPKSYVDVPEIEALSEPQMQTLGEMRAYLAGARAHKLFGHPNWEQAPAMPAGHRLLLQIDSDAYAKIEGKLYFTISDDDLAACRFDRAGVIRQSRG